MTRDPDKKLERFDQIPANPNSFNNGVEDPEPQKGQRGRWRRSVVSYVKGWFTSTSTSKKKP